MMMTHEEFFWWLKGYISNKKQVDTKVIEEAMGSVSKPFNIDYNNVTLKTSNKPRIYSGTCTCNPKNGGSGICNCTMSNQIMEQ